MQKNDALGQEICFCHNLNYYYIIILIIGNKDSKRVQRDGFIIQQQNTTKFEPFLLGIYTSSIN